MTRLRALSVLLLLAPVAASAFSAEVHEDVTRRAAADLGYSGEAADGVATGNHKTDQDEFEDPAAHFDGERFAAGSARLRAKLEAAHAALGGCDAAAAREQLGRGLHAVQDFFAHSNWVENHAADDPLDLLEMKDAAPGVVCDGETHLGPLTSGYWPDDARPAPFKCVHAELNKDEPGRPFHAAARTRALAETKSFLAAFERAELDAGPGGEDRLRLLKGGLPSALCWPSPARP